MKTAHYFKTILFVTMAISLFASGLVNSRPALAAPTMQGFEEDCFAVADVQDELVRFNKLTGDTTVIGDTFAPDIEAIAFIPGAARLYAADDNRLGTLNLSSGLFTALPFAMGTGSGSAGDIEFTDIDGLHFDATTSPPTLYAVHRREAGPDPDVLFKIDHTTGLHIENAFGTGRDYIEIEVPTGTPFPYHDVDDLAINPVTGELFGIANYGGGLSGLLVIIDKTDGSIEVVGETYPADPEPADNLVIDDLEGLSFFNDGRLYGSTGRDIDSHDANRLWQIDENTGVSTLVGQFSGGLADIEGLACLTAEAFLGIEKTVNGVDANLPDSAVQLPIGSTATWTFITTNTGGATARDVEITDDQLGDITDCDQSVPARLDPGESITCTATGRVTEGLHRNVATVTGVSVSSGRDLSANDPAHYFGYTARIQVEKSTNTVDADTAPGPSITNGSTVTWTYAVSNTGTVDLADVTVNDDQEGSVCTIALLRAGDTQDCTATGTAEFGQYDNTATATGTAVDEDGDPILDSDGDEITPSDTDDSHYYGIGDPSITIEKSTDGQDADTAPGPVIKTGETVDWRYVVRNTGDVDLINVTVTDNRGVTVDCPQTTLDPNESMTCTGSGSATEGQYDNLGTATGSPLDASGNPLQAPDGGDADDVTDSDPSHYFGVTLGLTIEKRVAGHIADVAPGPSFPIGTQVNWTYIVTNTSNVPLQAIELTDDQGVAVDCPADTLTVDASMTCTASGVVTAGPYVNIGEVTAIPVGPRGFPLPPMTGEDTTEDGTATQLDAADPANHVGIVPALEIEKRTNDEHVITAPGPFITVGGAVEWTYIVSNNTPFRITDITVEDDQGVTVTCPETALDAGTSMTCTGSGSATLGQYVNEATTSGTPVDENGDPFLDEAGDPITTDPATDDSFYFGADPSIDIEKSTNNEDADSAPGPYLIEGSVATWQYVVTNTGNVTLINVAVTDDQGVSVSCPGTLLEPSASMTCEGSGFVTAGQYANEGAVTADPADERNAPIEDENGDPLVVTDTDDSHYFGAAPAVTIEKSTNGADADAAPGPALLVNNTAKWDYVVTNTGNVNLIDVVVTDDQGVTVTCPETTLDVGATMTCTASDTVTIGQYVNQGQVNGTPVDENGNPLVNEDSDPLNVTDTDDSHYFGIEPSVSIEKSTNGLDADTNPGPLLTLGDPVEWEYVVTNTGNVRLEDLGVTDDQGVTVACPASALDPAESMTCTASGTVEADQYVNQGRVTGGPVDSNGDPILDEDGDPLRETATDDSHYFGVNPQVDIEKRTQGRDADETPGPYLAPGDTVNWEYVVTNTGNMRLVNLAVVDDQGVSVTCPETILDPDDSMTCSGSGTVVEGQYTNQGQVTGEPVDPAGDPVLNDSGDPIVVEDTDDSHYFGNAPSVSIEKTANASTVALGSDVGFTIVVTNTGNVPLTEITVTDSLTPDCEKVIDELAVGGSVEYNCIATNVNANFTNVADVEARDPNNERVADEDDAVVTIPGSPGIGIEKAPATQAVLPGADAEFTITVTNTGDTALTDVAVSDALTPSCDRTFDSLPIGASETYTCVATVVTTAFTNVAIVTGTPPTGGTVRAEDDAEVTLTGAPSIEIEKAPEIQTIEPGANAEFAITVFNTGDVLLTDIAVSDPQVPECDNTIGSLPPGELFTYTCIAVGVGGSFVNVATAIGEDPSGSTVSDDDDATVTVNAQASLGDFVFHDVNGNGIQETDEPGIADQMVLLLDQFGTVIGERRTDANGGYRFDGLTAGTYSVEFRPNTQYHFTLEDAGIDDATDSDPAPTAQQFIGEVLGINLPNNQSDFSIDAGVYIPSALGNYVFLDINNDGIQDADEPGVANVTVNLLDADGNIIITTLTDASGYYNFTDLAPGTYQVEVLRPNEFDRFALQDQGTNDTLDSDVNENGRTVLVTINSGTIIDTIDAGLVRSQVQGKTSVATPILEKIASVQRAKLGDDVAYQIVVSNPAEFDVTALVVTDALPPELDFVSTDLGDYNAAARTVVYTVGTLAPGQSITINVVAKVNTVAAAGQAIVNVATASANEGGSEDNATVTVIPPVIPVTGFQAGTFAGMLVPILILIAAIIGSAILYTLICTFSINATHTKNERLSRQLVSGLLSVAFLMLGSGVAAWMYAAPNRTQVAPTEVARILVTGYTATPLPPSAQAEHVIVSTPDTQVVDAAPQATDASPSTEVEPANLEAVAPPVDVEVANLDGTGEGQPMVLSAISEDLTSLLRPGNTDPSVPHLSIPRLRLTENVTAVPLLADAWDLYSLEQEIGWLPTTGAYPGDDLAMVFAAHVNVRSGRAGPFHDLNQLQVGDQIVYVHEGLEYIYEMRSSEVLDPTDVEQLYVEDGSQILLITCQNWDGRANTYSERLVVTAELIAGP